MLQGILEQVIYLQITPFRKKVGPVMLFFSATSGLIWRGTAEREHAKIKPVGCAWEQGALGCSWSPKDVVFVCVGGGTVNRD